MGGWGEGIVTGGVQEREGHSYIVIDTPLVVAHENLRLSGKKVGGGRFVCWEGGGGGGGRGAGGGGGGGGGGHCDR